MRRFARVHAREEVLLSCSPFWTEARLELGHLLVRVSLPVLSLQGHLLGLQPGQQMMGC